MSNYYNKKSEDGINIDSIKGNYKLPKNLLISEKDKYQKPFFEKEVLLKKNINNWL